MTEPSYPYLHIDVSPDESEEASALLWELGAQGLEERDTHTLEAPEGDAGELTLVASFESRAQADEALAALPEHWRPRLRFVVGDQWREAWRAYFKPSRVGRRLVVRPSWEPYAAAPDDAVITLDPGCAFGTGTHESTRLVMAALERLVQPGQAVLDVGCGSGILSIAALRLGAGSAYGIDVDPEAVRVSLENAAHNGVGDRLRAATQPVAEVEARYPLVLANIEAVVLIPLARAIADRVAPGGVLVLSGILAEQSEAVRRAYPELTLRDQPAEGDWVALVLER